MNDYKEAALVILKADFMLLSIGAGFSAESGLKLYKEVANIEAYSKKGLTYAGISRPLWLQEDPELFYGFWGKCFNDYQAAQPHMGYTIVKKWRDMLYSHSNAITTKFQQRLRNKIGEDTSDDVAGPFYIYSSNVDPISKKAGFASCEMMEIHGSLGKWQCSIPCTKEVWDAPTDFQFQVDLKTMLAKDNGSSMDFTTNNGFIGNHPRCKNCGKPARPSVFMFGDSTWIRNDEQPWWRWRSEVMSMLQEHADSNLVIVEIGCGKRVATVRNHSEHILKSTEQCKLIRINLEHPYLDTPIQDPSRVISIKEKSLPALLAIDKEIINLVEVVRR